MRLLKFQKTSGQPTYMIDEITMIELGYLQLALIMAGQQELRVRQDWKPTPIKNRSEEGRHERPTDAGDFAICLAGKHIIVVPEKPQPCPHCFEEENSDASASLSRHFYIRCPQGHRPASGSSRADQCHPLGGVRRRQGSRDRRLGRRGQALPRRRSELGQIGGVVMAAQGGRDQRLPRRRSDRRHTERNSTRDTRR